MVMGNIAPPDSGPFLLLILKLLIIMNKLCACQEDTGPPSSIVKTNSNTFRKLDISTKYLKGARWEIDANKTERVFHSIEITDVSKINVENGEFTLDMNLRQRWTEENLEFPSGLFLESESNDQHVTADSNVLEELWVPDLYFPNARTTVIESLVSKHSNVLIFKNKTIIYFATLQTTLGCPMEFQWYPLDVQRCSLSVESYTYPTTNVEFVWEDSSPPVTLPDQLKLRRFALRRPLIWFNETAGRFGRDEMYSRITITFVFERELGHHIIQVFIPTFLIVSLSWFSFWLGLDAIPARVGLLVTCMLTVVTMYTALKADLPPVTYIKILDIWMAACLLFIFAAMSEFIVVRTINHMQKARNEHQAQLMAEEASQKQRRKSKNHLGYDDVEQAKNNGVSTLMAHADQKTDNKLNEYFFPNDIPISEFYSHVPIEEQFKALKAGHHATTRIGWEPLYHHDYSKLHQRIPLRDSDTTTFIPTVYYHQKESGQHPQLNGQRNNNNKDYHERDNAKRAKHRATSNKRKRKRTMPFWEKIDYTSRIAFPLLFLCFCAVYWPILIFGSRTQ